MVIAYAYTSVLISFLSSTVLEKPINTWQELLDSDYTVRALIHNDKVHAFYDIAFVSDL